jgi:NADH-quinone oxidoreductase subunit N
VERSFELLGPAGTALVTSAVILLAGLVVREWKWLGILALVGVATSAIQAVIIGADGRQGDAFGGQFVVDNFALFFIVLFAAVAAVIILASLDSNERIAGKETEYFALLLASTGGLMLLASARDLVSIYLALELTGLSQYSLAAIMKGERSAESGLKYLLLGAISSAVLLYGFTILFGLTGSTLLTEIGPAIADSEGTRPAIVMAIVFIAAGFSFKMSILPFQMWAPDVYQGSPAPVAAYLSVASKAAAFAVVIRVFFEVFGDEANSETWSIFFAIVAACTMTLGNVMALWQSNIRRLLGYSSIAQAGNFVVGVAAVTAAGGLELGATSVLFFIAAYAFTNLAAFLAIIAISNRIGSDEIADFAGMSRRSPALAFTLAIAFLSLSGLPPTAGFIAKFYIFDAAVQSDLVWLVIIAVLNSGISAYYYLGVVRMLFKEAGDEQPVRTGLTISATAAMAALAVVFFGVIPGPLFDAAETAAQVFARG